MMYSVFVPEEGLYHYYESAKGVAVNADLPVPGLPSDAGKIGVAAMDAARPLPSDAKLVGQGWNARGVLASRPAGVSGLGAIVGPGAPIGTFLLAGVAGALVGAVSASWYSYRSGATPRQTSAGAGAYGAVVGFALGTWASKQASS